MNHIYHRFLELERITHGSATRFYHFLMASKMMRYRYYIVAILSLLLVVEVVPAVAWSIPSGSELLWIGVLSATSLAWMGMAVLIVMERTIHYFSIRSVYYLLVVFPLFLMAEFGILSLLISIPSRQEVSPNPSSSIETVWWIISIYLIPAIGIAFLVGNVALRTVLAGHSRTLRLYLAVVMSSIGISAALYALSFVIMAALETTATGRYIGYIVAFLVVYATPIVLPIVGTVLTARIRFPRQYIVIGALAVWAVITVVGWAWPYLITIDNGLSAFTGQERKEAEDALGDTRLCDHHLDTPPAIRVVKDDDGNFRVLGYTWWGLPSGASSCGPYKQWNRW